MKSYKIVFAITEESISKKHFGDTDNFALYNISEKTYEFIKNIKNPFLDIDESTIHGSNKKRTSILSY